jgi:hypothetical protein
MLLLRAIGAFIALPGIVAFVIPVGIALAGFTCALRGTKSHGAARQFGARWIQYRERVPRWVI